MEETKLGQSYADGSEGGEKDGVGAGRCVGAGRVGESNLRVLLVNTFILPFRNQVGQPRIPIFNFSVLTWN